MTGENSQKQIDHINGNRADNRWLNLREADSCQNRQNMKRSSRNTSGFKGVSWHERGQKWMAQIACRGGREHLGLFDTIEAAYAAYCAAAKRLHGEFARFK